MEENNNNNGNEKKLKVKLKELIDNKINFMYMYKIEYADWSLDDILKNV